MSGGSDVCGGSGGNLFCHSASFATLRRYIFWRNFCVATLRNSLNFIMLNHFIEPSFHRSCGYSENVSLLDGILLGEVLRKHLEELTLEHIATNLTYWRALDIWQHLVHHRGMHQQFVPNEQHCLKILVGAYYSLR